MKKPRRELPDVGSVFAIPLADHRWAREVIVAHGRYPLMQARIDRRSYSSIDSIPDAISVEEFPIRLTKLHGPLGIWEGEWKLLCRIPSFDSNTWFQPEFYSQSDDGVLNLDRKTLSPTNLRKAAHGEIKLLPHFGVDGDVFLQEWLAVHLDLQQT